MVTAMMGSEVLSDAIEHGTVAGFRAGCKSSHCPAPLVCREVAQRYAGDWRFKRQVDAGVPLEEILAADARAGAEARQREVAARATPRATEQEPRAPRAPQGHGTDTSYTRGCRCELCREASRVYQREYYARRRGVPAERRRLERELSKLDARRGEIVARLAELGGVS